jgi:hypothetical protein
MHVQNVNITLNYIIKQCNSIELKNIVQLHGNSLHYFGTFGGKKCFIYHCHILRNFTCNAGVKVRKILKSYNIYTNEIWQETLKLQDVAATTIPSHAAI